MTGAEWAVLVPAVAGLLGAGAAYLRAAAASRSAQSAHTRIDGLTPSSNVQAKP